LIACFFYYDLGSYLSLESLKESKGQLDAYYQQNQILSIAGYMLIYILATALSLPGATILTLAGGAVFGLGLGLLIVSFSSSIGATCAFLASRYILRDSIEAKYKKQFDKINEGVQRDGAFYLFSLRLIPVVPFFIINLLMGLTKMKAFTFYWVSQLGMLAGTAVYVNAGEKIAEINSLKDIVSFDVLISFVLLGIFPLIAKKIVSIVQARKVYKNFKKPKSFDYNIVAIGAGAGGLITSYIAAAVKAKVALIEKHKMGGDCLNTGCVPSKAIIRSGKIRKLAKDAATYGLKPAELDFDFPDVMNRVHKIIGAIEPHDSVERYEGLGVNCFTGEAKILSPWEVEVNGKVLSAKNIVIATGGSPLVPQFTGIDEVRSDILTSENLWDIKVLPKKLVVLGAGPIGSEMAQAFSRLGSEVTIVDMADRLLAREDEDASEIVKEAFIKDGVQLKLNSKISSFHKKDSTNYLVVETTDGKQEIPFDKCICALGRKANTKGFGAEELGIELNDNGTIKTNEKLQTNFPNIYAVGDVAGPYQFTHTASHMAWYASVNALFFNRFKVDYSVVPWATFVDPEVARVGLSEAEAKEKDIAYEVYKYDLEDSDRAIADSANKGFVKVLLAPGKDKILGATIVASNASDLIAEFTLAMKHGLGLNKIMGTMHLYPSMMEANKSVAGVWKNATKPEWIMPYLQKFHAWRR
tara:strand:+ start:337 stop:2427 length:2091 start_codon:yes stop_codon:yes gene_type:complete